MPVNVYIWRPKYLLHTKEQRCHLVESERNTRAQDRPALHRINDLFLKGGRCRGDYWQDGEDIVIRWHTRGEISRLSFQGRGSNTAKPEARDYWKRSLASCSVAGVWTNFGWVVFLTANSETREYWKLLGG